ncbi:MAG: triose-phosphate isomerase [Endomicrobiales bacterium]|nr:triose-phosphate isomerase [Endomicrobiales bacterium]
MRTPLLAGNWKMFKNVKESVELVNGLKTALADVKNREILVCPSFTALTSVFDVIKNSNIKLGAQNLFWESKGAFTGEVSPGMIAEVGCSYVLIGHSERRQFFGETDATVNKKIFAVFALGLKPIVCVGETLQERESDKTLEVLKRQLTNGLAGLSAEQAKMIVVAYEPVWAIGTGKTATTQQAQDAHAFIRKVYEEMYGKDAAALTRILYGGSVKPDNIAELMKQPDVDGGLVGGASLDVNSFTKIVKY